jgi:hypothetical protein
MDIDNFDEPDAGVEGRIIDAYTGGNLLSSQGGFSIRIWERTWKEESLDYQSLAIKQDGSYKNAKLFAGTYDMLCYGGAFWPCDTVKNVQLSSKGTTVQDFDVTPYLQIESFQYKLEAGGSTGRQLVLSCRLKAPRINGLPNLYELKSFVNTTPWCGSSSYINVGEYANSRITFGRSWADEMAAQGLPVTSSTSVIYALPAMPVKSGYTYWVRVGAAVNDSHRNYNYSDIVKVDVL